jgi:predicted nucleic acid-binding protein
MTTFFVDSSALAKRYLREVGSNWVLSWIEPAAGNVIVISDLALVEIRTMLARRVREKTLSPTRAVTLKADFLLHAKEDYLVVALDDAVTKQAANLADRYPLRALDSIQLACALHAVALLNEPMTFISGDKILLSAATSEGFIIDDPNAHP